MVYHKIEVVPLAGALGAEIHGVDLAEPLDDATFGEIHQAFLDHLVIFFRNQRLTPEQHKAFGRRFGSLNIHPHYEPLADHPEILRVLKEPDATQNIGGAWHSDMSFLAEPPLGSILYALEVPPRGGGTMFANQYLAYEMLSDGLKSMLRELKAVHRDAVYSTPDNKTERNASRSTQLKSADRGETINRHPVVRTHPETGRPSLFVNPPFVRAFEGLSEAESAPILQFLFTHMVKPEFTCRFRWDVGSVAFWDNRCVQHYALNDYQGYRREMYRVTVNGDRPY